MGTLAPTTSRQPPPCSLSSSLLPSPRPRRVVVTSVVTSVTSEQLLPLLPPQTYPIPFGLSLMALRTRRAATLRGVSFELTQRPPVGRSLIHQPPRSSCLRKMAPTSASSSLPLSPRSGRLALELPTTTRAAPRAAASTPRPTARRSKRLRLRWRRTSPSGGGPPPAAARLTSGPKSRLILNKNKNDVGDEAALCVKAPGADSFALLVGKTANCKNSCCVFQCLSCPEEE